MSNDSRQAQPKSLQIKTLQKSACELSFLRQLSFEKAPSVEGELSFEEELSFEGS